MIFEKLIPGIFDQIPWVYILSASFCFGFFFGPPTFIRFAVSQIYLLAKRLFKELSLLGVCIF